MARLIPTWYLLVAMFVSTFVLAAGGIAYTRYAIVEERKGSERRQCEEIKGEVDYYVLNPPDTPRAESRRDYYEDRYQEICVEEAP